MKTLTKTEIATLNGRTVYLSNVKNVADGLGKTERVVKPSTNAKIGEKLIAGPWRGRVFTVTLEERATCSAACLHWKDCYGNNMPFATRYAANDALIQQIEKDLAHWQAQTDKQNAKRAKIDPNLESEVFAVRLHVLGDFFSVEYVQMWAKWLRMFPSLRVWGYTHWHPGTAIGNAILALREAMGGLDAREGGRFCIRFSDCTADGAGALAQDHSEAADLLESREAFICPEQTQTKARSEGPNAIKCANCAACWMSKKNVFFLTH